MKPAPVIRAAGPCGLLLGAAWLFFLFFHPGAGLARADGPYADELVGRAVSRGLFRERAWMALLHYRPSVLHGTESLVDDPKFFNSPEGKRDPQKEMEATIRAFFRDDADGDTHPQCVFVARFGWLKKELGMDESRLPRPACKDLNELMENLNPESAVLVFPVSHINSPASMFGHTLLRIDSSADSKLLSWAVNYSATTRETNGMLFAFKGIFGFYEGYFSLLPYYEKIKEYSGLENRDMWEYGLDYTKEEVKKIVLHMWEMKDIYSYYYFFDENCSYNLLLALEAGRPEADLTGALAPWVIPMETVRAIKTRGLHSTQAYYRPSRATKIKRIEHFTNSAHQEKAKELAGGLIRPEEVVADPLIASPDKIKILDLAAEYLQYLYAKKKIEKNEYLGLYLKVLTHRSKLGIGSGYDMPPPAPPEAGHGPARIAVGAGVKKGASYGLLRIRPANHDLLDDDDGYLPGAAISFLDTEFRYNLTQDKFSLERLTLVDITSISGIDRFFRPVSWKVSTGLAREEFAKREHRTIYKIEGGPGAAFEMSNGLLYAFAGPEIKLGDGLENGYAAGAWASAGVLKPITGNWKARLEVKAAYYALGSEHAVVSAGIEQNYKINRNNAVRLNIFREKFGKFHSNDINLSWNRYF